MAGELEGRGPDGRGSILFRKLLGNRMRELREARGYSQATVADRLQFTIATISRYEGGKKLIDPFRLKELVEWYALDERETDNLNKLYEIAQKTPWWAHLGQQSAALEAMLMLEDNAHRLREYDQNAIPGLLQTPPYARAVNETVDVGMSTEQVDRGVRLRTERQKKIWQGVEPKLDATFLIDEGALWRMPGPAELQRAQLTSLLDLPTGATLQVVPFNAGPNVSLATYLIYDFALGATDSVKGVYVEGAAAMQGVIAETEAEVQRYEIVFERTRANALSIAGTAAKINEVIRSIDDG